MGDKQRSTDVKGVAKLIDKNKYIAKIQILNKTKSKTFNTYEEAVQQRKDWEHERTAYYMKVGRWDLIDIKTDSDKLCTDNCLDCKYSEQLTNKSSEPCCMYIVMVGHKRPCKAGDGCTVKIERDKDHNKLKRMNYIDSLVCGTYSKRKKRVTRDLRKLT